MRSIIINLFLICLFLLGITYFAFSDAETHTHILHAASFKAHTSYQTQWKASSLVTPYGSGLLYRSHKLALLRYNITGKRGHRLCRRADQTYRADKTRDLMEHSVAFFPL